MAEEEKKEESFFEEHGHTINVFVKFLQIFVIFPFFLSVTWNGVVPKFFTEIPLNFKNIGYWDMVYFVGMFWFVVKIIKLAIKD